MLIGINFFVTAHTVDVATLARAVDELGFDSLWLPDHPVLPVAALTEYHRGDGRPPDVYGQMGDPFVLLAAAGAVTTRIKVCTGICLAAARHPLLLAKTVSTLDTITSGRLLLGVGAGWSAAELALFGVEFRDRWEHLEEAVLAMKALWHNGRASFDGTHVAFPEVICDPRPVTKPHPPILIGAGATDATIGRVARWADGWVPVFVEPSRVARAREQLIRECESIGRDPDEIEISVFVKDATPATQEAYRRAGVSRLIIQLYNHPGTPMPIEEWERHHTDSGSLPPPVAEETLGALTSLAELAQLS